MTVLYHIWYEDGCSKDQRIVGETICIYTVSFITNMELIWKAWNLKGDQKNTAWKLQFLTRAEVVCAYNYEDVLPRRLGTTSEINLASDSGYCLTAKHSNRKLSDLMRRAELGINLSALLLCIRVKRGLPCSKQGQIIGFRRLSRSMQITTESLNVPTNSFHVCSIHNSHHSVVYNRLAQILVKRDENTSMDINFY